MNFSSITAKKPGNTKFLKQCFGILQKSDQRKIFIVILMQFCLNLLDLLGVALIGLLGSLAVTGVSGKQPGNRVTLIFKFLKIENFSLQSQFAILGLIAAISLTLKTIFSLYFTRKSLFFLSRKSAQISQSLITRLLSCSISDIQSRSMQETIYAVTSGVTVIMVGIIGSFISLIADSILIAMMCATLFTVDLFMAVITSLLFGGVAWFLYLKMHKKATELGLIQSKYNIESSDRISEVVLSFREVVTKNRQNYYAKEIGDLRGKLADSTAALTFQMNVGKYVMELVIVFSAIIIGLIQFLTHTAMHAIAVLSIFIAASTRIGPAVLRVQQAFISMRGNFGTAIPTLNLLEQLDQTLKTKRFSNDKDSNSINFAPYVKLKDVSYSYPNDNFGLSNINLEIGVGSLNAIVGPSGAGKSTLVDLILGIIEPKSGLVQISGKAPSYIYSNWPNAIGYVPQDVTIFSGTLKQNIALGFSESETDLERVNEAIKLAQLEDMVSELKYGIESNVGERGTKLSGGQRQRIGIARALYTSPKLLVLDEATSALDAVTESQLSKAIKSLRGKVTIIVIAHRLSTIRESDQVIYLDSGSIKAIGTFEQVRSLITEFDSQARLMGL